MEKTLILAKPDALQRGLVGEIIGRLEAKGLKLVGLKMMQPDDSFWEAHYAHLIDKPFFPGIKSFMKSAPIVAICVEGINVVDVVRKICGITNARDAEPGTIRGDFSMSIQCNIVHASDSIETAMIELPRFFNKNELFVWNKDMTRSINSPEELNE